MPICSPRVLAPLVLGLLAACTVEEVGTRNESLGIRGSGASATSIARSAGWRVEAWTPPSIDSLSDNPEGRSIRRGLALFQHTRDSLPNFARSNLSCASCHLQNGRKTGAIPLYGVTGMYPRYNARADAVVSMADRVNYCFTRSLAGTKLPAESREMQDVIAYLSFLSRGIPGGVEPVQVSLPKMTALAGDSSRGVEVYAASCARCHGPQGAGNPIAPALWGARSFSVGASMARTERAAAFISANMPFDSAGVLSDQQAWDVAAYITALPRPDMPEKAEDWPRGDAPSDVPYATAGRKPAKTVRVLPRTDPAGAMVPAPQSVRGARGR